MGRVMITAIIGVLLMCSPAQALEMGGATLPDTMAVEGRDLVLNGAGLRKKFFVKVYVMGLYLPQETQDAGNIIQADEPMAARMHFIYDGVSAKDLVDAWQEGFENSTGGDLDPVRERVETFNGYFTEEAKENEVYEFVYAPGEGVRTLFNGRVVGTIPGLDFKQALFGIWLGEKPADKSLKKGMLGQ
ncbi:MAG: chalcone isomerase family protein [Thermodesulfobacteriota bacterium]